MVCFHVVVLATSLVITVKINPPPCLPVIVGRVSEAGRAVGAKELVCVCVCVYLERVCEEEEKEEDGDLTCNSSSQRFPTLLFSAAVRLCSSVSSHVVISALAGSLLKVTAQQHNVISL